MPGELITPEDVPTSLPEPAPEVAATPVIEQVPTVAEAPDPMQQATAAAKEMITGVPDEIGGADVRAATKADEQARADEMARRDETETNLGPASVKSVVPPQFQKPPTPEA